MAATDEDLKEAKTHDEMFNKAVDNALNRVFGGTATNIIYSHLENRYSIRKDEIATKLESFGKAMQEYLSSGAAVIESEIVQDLNSYKNSSHIVELIPGSLWSKSE